MFCLFSIIFLASLFGLFQLVVSWHLDGTISAQGNVEQKKIIVTIHSWSSGLFRVGISCGGPLYATQEFGQVHNMDANQKQWTHFYVDSINTIVQPEHFCTISLFANELLTDSVDVMMDGQPYKSQAAFDMDYMMG